MACTTASAATSGTAEVQFASGARLPVRRVLDRLHQQGRSRGGRRAEESRIRDEGISDTRGRDKRPGLDALLKGVARREFDIIAAWSVCRLGRSLSDLIGLLGELRSHDIDLYLHQPAHDTSTPSGRMLFGMLGVFS